jgi:PD-(D/E)XK endonuclease
VIAVRLRTSRHSPSRAYVVTTYTAGEIDGIAAYCAELDRCLFLPIDEFERRTFAHLRLGPARNGQVIGVKMADDYPLGAVAQLGERSAGSRKVRGSSPLSSISKIRPITNRTPRLQTRVDRRVVTTPPAMTPQRSYVRAPCPRARLADR